MDTEAYHSNKGDLHPGHRLGGLIHCDITYEVVLVWKGGMFRLSVYLDRFEASMVALHLDPDMTRAAIQSALTQMAAASGLRNS